MSELLELVKRIMKENGELGFYTEYSRDIFYSAKIDEEFDRMKSRLSPKSKKSDFIGTEERVYVYLDNPLDVPRQFEWFRLEGIHILLPDHYEIDPFEVGINPNTGKFFYNAKIERGDPHYSGVTRVLEDSGFISDLDF